MKFIDFNELQPLNIDFELLINDELKFDKSIDNIESQPLNIFSQLLKDFFHINLILFISFCCNSIELNNS